MNDLVKQLALALHAYEADEPHIEGGGFYPRISYEELEAWLRREHDGDCAKQPQICRRCWAEEILRKAKWIANEIK